MTNEELQAHLAALRGAILAGKIEERRDDEAGQWGVVSAEDGMVISDQFDHRIKLAAPRELYVIFDSNQRIVNTIDYPNPATHGSFHTRKFREVLE